MLLRQLLPNMDSKVINKLIRSEIWPILREQGFSLFDSRNAFAYKDQFINVVNFQSFNSYLAGGLNCTTFSFAVNLGAYVVGSPGAEHVRIGKAGHLMPFESQCSFRSQLKKRTPVDGFARDDVFYIDPDGRTTAACFLEVQGLLREFAAPWFQAQNDLEELISRMHQKEERDSSVDIDTSGRVGSFLWSQLKSVLLLAKHQEAPSQDSADAALGSINHTIGMAVDLSHSQSGPPGEERYTLQMRELRDQLGEFRPVPICSEKSTSRNGCLDGPIWEPRPAQQFRPIQTPNEAVVARKQIWPLLKDQGFTEFTDRLAHRVSSDLVEVVEFLPMDPFERKTSKHPEGLFRVGIGVFWPTLWKSRFTRTNRKQEPRPLASDCHISNWLIPNELISLNARTAFHSVEDALAALTGPGFGWLDIFKSHASTLSMLQRKDWELFWCNPMMRGYGASESSQRFVYLARLHHLLGNTAECEDCLLRAQAAIPGWLEEYHRTAHEEWIDRVRARLLA